MHRFCSGGCRFESSTTTLPQISLQRYIGLDDAGLVLGAGTALVRRDPATHRLVLNADRDRCLALLSVALRQPVAPAILEHIQTAAEHWQGGDKALANLRLVFAGLRKLDGPADAHRLQAAGYLLDQGVAPQDLMNELGLDASGLGLDKYAPDQPRVPAGRGRESGRWSDGTTGAQIVRDVPEVAVPAPQSPHRIEVAANGPFMHGGINVLPVPPGDTLDPRGLNKPLGFAEQQAIADTFNSIMTGQPYNMILLDPHSYKNWPSEFTGAILPEPIGKYTTYRVPSPGGTFDMIRLIMDKGGQIFYTNNHYKSFYPVDLKPSSK